AVGRDHPLREPARRVVVAIRDGVVDATTTTAVVQEFAHVFARRRSRAEAAAAARDHATLLAPLIGVEQEHVGTAIDIFERTPRLAAFDSFLAAAALAARAIALVSADRGYADVDGLRFVDLGNSADLDALLA